MAGKRRRIPATKRLAGEWEKRIRSGELRPGDPLPSMRVLAEERNVDLSSVLGAYRLLEKQGLIVREHGRGCYVGSEPYPPHPGRQKRRIPPARTGRIRLLFRIRAPGRGKPSPCRLCAVCAYRSTPGAEKTVRPAAIARYYQPGAAPSPLL